MYNTVCNSNAQRSAGTGGSDGGSVVGSSDGGSVVGSSDGGPVVGSSDGGPVVGSSDGVGPSGSVVGVSVSTWPTVKLACNNNTWIIVLSILYFQFSF